MTENDFRQKILQRLVVRNNRENEFHEIILNSELILFFSLCPLFYNSTRLFHLTAIAHTMM
jgi:hypothetical protein